MFNCFKKDYDYGQEEFIPNWGIIIPHTRRSGGAKSFDGLYDEYIYAHLMTREMKIPVATRDLSNVLGAAKELVKDGCNASLEPHYNAYNGKAHGASIFVLKGDSLSEKYARLMIEDFAEMFPNRKLRHDNGLKFLVKGDRGYYNLEQAKKAGMKIALLSELFFGDNENDFMSPETQSIFWEGHLYAASQNIQIP